MFEIASGEAFHEAGVDTPSSCSSSDEEKILNNGPLFEDKSPYSLSSSLNDQSETLENQDQDQTSILNKYTSC